MIRSVSVAAGLVFSLAAASTVQAQNNKPIRSGTFYEDRASGSLSSTTLSLSFAQAPADKFLNITRLACTMAMGNAQSLGQVFLFLGTTSGGNEVGRNHPVEVVNNSGAPNGNGFRYISLSAPSFLKVGPGRFPSVSIYAPGTGTLFVGADCTFVGNLTDD